MRQIKNRVQRLERTTAPAGPDDRANVVAGLAAQGIGQRNRMLDLITW